MIKGATTTPDYTGIPTAVFTIPELVRVGMLEAEATEHGIDLAVRYSDTSGWYSSYRVGETTPPRRSSSTVQPTRLSAPTCWDQSTASWSTPLASPSSSGSPPASSSQPQPRTRPWGLTSVRCCRGSHPWGAAPGRLGWRRLTQVSRSNPGPGC